MAKNDITLFIENGVTYANVSDLRLYKDNPRDVEAKDFERLKEQLSLGEHSPLLITTDGEVLGGNTRLRAYKELGKQRAKVVVVEITETSEGVRITVDRKLSERRFDTIDQAKIELALSHNDSIGTNNELKLAELMVVHNVPTDIYSVTTKIKPVGDIVNALSPSDEDLDTPDVSAEPNDSQAKRIVKCPNCQHEWELGKEGGNAED